MRSPAFKDVKNMHYTLLNQLQNSCLAKECYHEKEFNSEDVNSFSAGVFFWILNTNSE